MCMERVQVYYDLHMVTFQFLTFFMTLDTKHFIIREVIITLEGDQSDHDQSPKRESRTEYERKCDDT